MSEDASIDSRPQVKLEIVDDHTSGARCDEGFLKLRRLSLKNRYADGSASAAYRYDLVEREALDAVAIVLVTRDDSSLRICLRSALRPPLAFRAGYAIPIPERDGASPVLWEVPAGLVEPDEQGEDGLRRCAAREALEETGLDVPTQHFSFLGPAAFLSPGVMAEKIHFLAARVDSSTRTVPTADGSPVEERAELRFIALDDALAACRDGRVTDLKTETAIRRAIEKWGAPT